MAGRVKQLESEADGATEAWRAALDDLARSKASGWMCSVVNNVAGHFDDAARQRDAVCTAEAHRLQLVAVQARFDATRRREVTLEGELAKLRREHEELALFAEEEEGVRGQVLSEVEAQVVQLTSELAASHQTNAETQSKLRDAQAQCETLRQVKDQVCDNLAKTEEALETCKHDLSEARSQAARAVNSKALTEPLERKLEALQSDNDALSAEVGQVRSEAQAGAAELACLRKKQGVQQAAAETKLKQMRESLKTSDEENQQLDALLAHARGVLLHYSEQPENLDPGCIKRLVRELRPGAAPARVSRTPTRRAQGTPIKRRTTLTGTPSKRTPTKTATPGKRAAPQLSGSG